MTLASRITDLVTAVALGMNQRNAPGASDYQVWLAQGNTGTIDNYRASVLGADADFAAAFDAAVGVNPGTKVATEALAGITQLATDAETLLGNSAKAISAKNLQAKLNQVTAPSSFALPYNNTGPTTNTWVRLATLNNIDGANGANAELLVPGLGGFGSPVRSTALVSVGGYGTLRKANVTWLSGPALPAGSVIFYTRPVSTYVHELWMRLGTYQYTPRVTILDGINITAVLDSIVTADPGSLVAIDNKETDWSFGNVSAPWGAGDFENSIRRIPNGLEIKFGVKKTNASAFAGGDQLIAFGPSIRPGVYSNGDQISIPAYTTTGAGWSIAPANGNITQNGIYYSGSASPAYGLFGSFRINDFGVN